VLRSFSTRYNTVHLALTMWTLYQHWRQPRRGCRGHIPQYLGWGDVNGNIPLILLRTFGYSRPILVALRSLSLKPISFGYKTPPIRFSQAGGQSASKAHPPNLELVLTPLFISKSPLSFLRPLTTWHCSPLPRSAGRAAIDRYLLPAGPTLPDFIRDPTNSTDGFRRLLKTYLFARY